MDESESGADQGGALNAAVPASPDSIEAIRQLLAEAGEVSRELGQLAEDMIAQSEVGRREVQRLIEALAEAAKAIGEEPAEAVPAEKPVSPAPRSTGSDGARLLARQMLANGTDRETVERNLTTSFHVEDAAAVVDSILP